jgi:hypothetical protein
MPSLYDHFELRLEVCGPVASESPFDSGTLWGRILHALTIGHESERALAGAWLAELREHTGNRTGFLPPLIISEGFSCDGQGEPWLPLPLAAFLHLQLLPDAERKIPRKELKIIDRVPKAIFAEICAGAKPDAKQLLELQRQKPETAQSLTPHLSMDRLSGTGRDGFLYLTSITLYQNGSNPPQTEAFLHKPAALPQIVFYMKVRQRDSASELVKKALDRICLQGWGHGKARGLGRIRLKSFGPCSPPPDMPDAQGFVSLSHFTPSANDPTEGQWKLKPKHPVPAQFLNDKKITLGEEDRWRVKSFLRLRAGSCLRFRQGEVLQEFYGRTLTGLLSPAEDHDGNKLPDLFHYAHSYPWPFKDA